jgi:argininosuccinate lyase
MIMTTNLPSGYHRDLQLLKEHLFPAFTELKNCLEMASLMIQNMEVKKDILEDPQYQYLFSVEEVNKLVLTGMPFRDAYKQVGASIEAGKFNYSTAIAHTHEGSIGNLGTAIIADKMNTVLAEMGYEKVTQRIAELLNT